MTSMHISDARRILNAGKPVKISAWKADGSIVVLEAAVSLRYDFRGGWRNVKLTRSGQVRRLRDICIFAINDIEVYL